MERIDTPEKVKEYLNAEGIEYDDAADNSWLYTLAKRRLKRRLFDEGAPVQRKSRNVGVARSLKDLMACLARLEAKGNASGEEEKAWPTVRFAIEDMPDAGTLVGLKHQIADSDMCTGNVVDSVCNRCHSHVPGVPAYSFKLLAKDTAESSVQLGIHVSHKGACELFKMGAAELRALSLGEQGRMIEAVEGHDRRV